MFRAPGMFTGEAAQATNVESEWCVGFDGSNDYVDCGSIALTDALSMSCWVWASGLPDGAFKLVIGSAANDVSSGTAMLLYGVAGTIQVRFQVFDSGATKYRVWVVESPTTAIGVGSWVHIAITQATASSAPAIYVNGVAQTVTAGYTAGGAPSRATNALAIGRYGAASSYYFPGRIDDVRIYSRAISSTEVTALYTNTSPTTDGLVAYLDLEEGSGTSAAIKNGAGATIGTATLTGATWHPQTPPKLVSGRALGSGCVSFDGSDDYVDCTGSGAINPSTTLTLSCWVRPANVSHNAGIVSKWTSAGAADSSYILYLGQDAANARVGLYVQQSNGTLRYIFGTTNLSANVWTHLACVADGSYLRLYVNGVSDGTAVTYDGTLKASTKRVILGKLRQEDSIYQLNGKLDDVCIYNTALTATQVATLARNQDVTDGLVARWKLDDGSGTTADDSVGTADGTLVNGPTWSTDVSQYHV